MLTPALVGSEVVLEQSCIRKALLFREYRIPPPASVRFWERRPAGDAVEV